MNERVDRKDKNTVCIDRYGNYSFISKARGVFIFYLSVPFSSQLVSGDIKLPDSVYYRNLVAKHFSDEALVTVFYVEEGWEVSQMVYVGSFKPDKRMFSYKIDSYLPSCLLMDSAIEMIRRFEEEHSEYIDGSDEQKTFIAGKDCSFWVSRKDKLR